MRAIATTTYAATIKSNSTVGYWQALHATTEIGAKREATSELGGGYIGDRLCLAIMHDDGDYQTIAERTTGDDTRWVKIG